MILIKLLRVLMRVVQYIHNKIVHSLREIYLILAVHQGTHYYCTLTLAWTGCYLLFVGRSTINTGNTAQFRLTPIHTVYPGITGITGITGIRVPVI